MHQALKLKKETQPEKILSLPCERTIYRIMQKIGLTHNSKHKPNSLTKADKEVKKSEDLLTGKSIFRSWKIALIMQFWGSQ
jgi:hypothetical protein